MSYLRKYARPAGDKLTQQYSTRLTDKDAKDFEAYCKELNLKPTEAVRYLILEELERVKSDTKISKNTSLVSNVIQSKRSTSFKTIDTRAKYQTKSYSIQRALIAKYKINNELPCPICQGWHSVSKYSARHAKKHGHDSTYDFLKAYQDEVETMYNKRLAKLKTDP